MVQPQTTNQSFKLLHSQNLAILVLPILGISIINKEFQLEIISTTPHFLIGNEPVLILVQDRLQLSHHLHLLTVEEASPLALVKHFQ